jgi:8-amino-7-oxononanoate synthase
MPDFTSALYLGWKHERLGAHFREPLTLGKPAALEEPTGAEELASGLAQLVGCAAGLCGPSTLHLFWDLPVVLGDTVEYFADAELYPIGRWSMERAAILGSKVTWFRHHDPQSLREAIGCAKKRPAVVTDGFCPASGCAAPLEAYLAELRPRGGLLVVDDTQALGILGRKLGGSKPYGVGGGGSLWSQGIAGSPDVALIISLAKAFGAPVACVASSASFIGQFADRSETRTHSSPPSTLAIRAGLDALHSNLSKGEAARSQLALHVREFRSLLRHRNWRVSGGCFPVQTVQHRAAPAIYNELLAQGIRTVLQPPRRGRGARITFLITALHDQSELTQAAEALSEAGARRARKEEHATAVSQSIIISRRPRTPIRSHAATHHHVSHAATPLRSAPH